MARSGAVTVNFLADTSPLRRGVRSVNRSLKTVGRGANLQGVARDMSKMNRGIGSLVGGLGSLRMGWFGVGAAASGALVGAAAAAQRIGNEWSEAVAIIERGTGMSIKSVDGMERAFQDLAGSVPESFEVIAGVFSTVMTDMVNESQDAGGAIGQNLAADAAQASQVIADAARAAGVDPNQLGQTITATTTGLTKLVSAADMVAHLAQLVPNLDANQLLSDFGRNASAFDYGSELALAPLASLKLHAGDPGSINAIRAAQDTLKMGPKEFGEIFDAIVSEAIKGGATVAQQQQILREMLSAPRSEGGLQITSDLGRIVAAAIPESGVLPFRLSEAGLGEIATASIGARARGPDLTLNEEWRKLFNNLQVELGPTALAVLNSGFLLVTSALEHLENEGFWTVLGSAIREVVGGAEQLGATLGAWTLASPLALAEVASHVLTGDGGWVGSVRASITDIEVENPWTTFDDQAVRQQIDKLWRDLLVRGEVDLFRVDPEDKEWIERQADDAAIEFAKGRGGLEGVSSTQLADVILSSPQFTDIHDNAGEVVVTLGRVIENSVAAQIEEEEAASRAAAERTTSAASASGSVIESAGVSAGNSINQAGQSFASNAVSAGYKMAAVIHASTAWAAADIGSHLGAKSPRVVAAVGSDWATQSWSRYVQDIDSLASSARGAAAALFDLEDGMHVLADGVIFRRNEILSQTTDADGLTSYTTSRGATTNRAANVDGGQIVHGGAQ